MAEATTTTTTTDVLDVDGERLGSVELPGEWFSGVVNIGVMHQVVTAQLANARRGSAKTKSRAEARGGGRKPWRQKGTGRARHGSIRSPIWVGGGVAHGRRVEENHGKRVNKRMKRMALRSALTDRARNGEVTVVRGLAFPAPRTKDAVATLEALGHDDRRVLVVLGDMHEPTWRSFRNLPDVHLLTVDQLNTYDVLRSDVVVFAEEALALIGTGQRSDPPEATRRPAASEAADLEALEEDELVDEEVDEDELEEDELLEEDVDEAEELVAEDEADEADEDDEHRPASRTSDDAEELPADDEAGDEEPGEEDDA